jgi:hypothetical protein
VWLWFELKGCELLKEENIMKKIMIAAIVMLTVLTFTVPAMAGAVNNKSSPMTFGGGADYDLSNNVYMDYTQASSNQVYGLGSVHSGGNRLFATSSETSVIFWKTCDKGTTASEVGDATYTTGGFTGAGWTPL